MHCFGFYYIQRKTRCTKFLLINLSSLFLHSRYQYEEYLPVPVPPPPIPPLPPEEPPLPEEEEEQISSGDESEYESDNEEEKERCAFYSLF